MTCASPLRQNKSAASTPRAARCSHLSQVSQKLTNAWKHPHAGPSGQAVGSAHVRALSLSHTCTHLHKLQTIWCVQINFRLLSTVFPAYFTSSPPQPSLCLSLLLLSGCRLFRCQICPPHPFASRWGKENSPNTCIKLYTILWTGTGGILGEDREEGNSALPAILLTVTFSPSFIFITFMRGQLGKSSNYYSVFFYS